MNSERLSIQGLLLIFDLVVLIIWNLHYWTSGTNPWKHCNNGRSLQKYSVTNCHFAWDARLLWYLLYSMFLHMLECPSIISHGMYFSIYIHRKDHANLWIWACNVSQCCMPGQVSRCNKQYLENVTLKINVKVCYFMSVVSLTHVIFLENVTLKINVKVCYFMSVGISNSCNFSLMLMFHSTGWWAQHSAWRCPL